jgi:DUF1680 family protein
MVASVGSRIYGVADDAIAVHLYGDNTARLDVAGRMVRLTQRSRYPWDGAVAIAMEAEAPIEFTLHLRIPGWCRKAALSVNGEAIDLTSVTHQGYAAISRKWVSGDRVRLDFDMPVEQVRAHPEVRQDVGRIALMRGPLVYCLERADNAVNLNRVRVPQQTGFEARFEPDLLNGVVTLTANVEADATGDWAGKLYRTEPTKAEPVPIKAVPYFVWGNRESGEMLVWLRSE